ncbi:MAG: DinB family protein [Chloroflexota bacterium]|nr:DinB family protein [Chloroflexota bacterium]
MPAFVQPIADERDGLLAYLAQQRDTLRFALSGIGDEQARLRPTASSLSLGGLLKHNVFVERAWVLGRIAQRQLPPITDWESIFRLGEDETVAGWLDEYAKMAAETEAIVRSIPDMGQPVPVPQDMPWFPKDVREWSVRWVLLHLIEETARHAGHADILRESIDGAQALELMADAEGWRDQYDAWMAPFQGASKTRVPYSETV